MARPKSTNNGRLEEALATMLQNQVVLVQTQTAFVARISVMDAQRAEMERVNSERFARIEAILLDHSRILTDHNRILEALTDAIRQKIGFKAAEQPGSSG
jgi:hypothetical protein